MTTNAFIFAWHSNGIEAIVPISQYEGLDADNTFRILANKPTERNPLDSIIRSLVLRAQFNTQRHYEIYAVDCSADLDEAYWNQQWDKEPQLTADLVRERGQKIYSDRALSAPVIL
tara:strand:+ start:73 stop:420 length:348 start_codon:yes stop_codon:yes gene_type:complete